MNRNYATQHCQFTLQACFPKHRNINKITQTSEHAYRTWRARALTCRTRKALLLALCVHTNKYVCGTQMSHHRQKQILHLNLIHITPAQAILHTEPAKQLRTPKNLFGDCKSQCQLAIAAQRKNLCRMQSLIFAIKHDPNLC